MIIGTKTAHGDLIDGYDNGYNPQCEYQRGMPNDEPIRKKKKPRGLGQEHSAGAADLERSALSVMPPMRYAWADTHGALMALRENGETDLYDGIDDHARQARWTAARRCRRSPGKHSCSPNNQKTLPQRHNITTFYSPSRRGRSVIEKRTPGNISKAISSRPAMDPGDHHENTHNEDTILFSIDDWRAMKKLGFYYEGRKPKDLRTLHQRSDTARRVPHPIPCRGQPPLLSVAVLKDRAQRPAYDELTQYLPALES